MHFVRQRERLDHPSKVATVVCNQHYPALNVPNHVTMQVD
jgi:hypothetical protein